jgi:hypothetical protein
LDLFADEHAGPGRAQRRARAVAAAIG